MVPRNSIVSWLRSPLFLLIIVVVVVPIVVFLGGGLLLFRMVMMGIELTGKSPFDTIYLHGERKGTKQQTIKTLGNRKKKNKRHATPLYFFSSRQPRGGGVYSIGEMYSISCMAVVV